MARKVEQGEETDALLHLARAMGTLLVRIGMIPIAKRSIPGAALETLEGDMGSVEEAINAVRSLSPSNARRTGQGKVAAKDKKRA